jgi:hypothetical protein
MPDRREIDAADMPPEILPYLALAEVREGGERFRYRLAGTELCRRFGADFTRKHSDEILSGDYLQFIDSLFQDVCTTQCPVYSESIFRWDVTGHLHTAQLQLPLCRGNSREVSMVLVGQVFSRVAGPWFEPLKLILEKDDAEHQRSIITSHLG